MTPFGKKTYSEKKNKTYDYKKMGIFFLNINHMIIKKGLERVRVS